MQDIYDDLFSAIEEDDVIKARSIIDSGANVNISVLGQKGGLIYYAASAEMFNLLAEAGIKLQPKTLVDAAYRSTPALVQCLIDYGLPINGVEEQGKLITPLMMASGSVQIASAKLLIAHGADPTIFGKRTRWTALHFAANNAQDIQDEMAPKNNHLEAINLLLANGANLEAQDDEGMTALIRAAFNLQPKVTEHLLHAGAYVHAVDLANRSALKNAEMRNNARRTNANAAKMTDDNLTLTLDQRQGNQTVEILKKWICDHPFQIDLSSGELIR